MSRGGDLDINNMPADCRQPLAVSELLLWRHRPQRSNDSGSASKDVALAHAGSKRAIKGQFQRKTWPGTCDAERQKDQ